MGVCNCKVPHSISNDFKVDQTNTNDIDNKLDNKQTKEIIYRKEVTPTDSKPSIGSQPHQGMNPKKTKR